MDESLKKSGDDVQVREGDLDGLPNVDEEGESAPDIDPAPDIDVPGVDEEEDPATRSWFLTPQERGNDASSIDWVPRDDGRGWVAGNQVRPLIHGATYFRRLHEELCELKQGDRLYFTDWRGDRDEKLLPDGPTIGEVLTDLAKAGVDVRACCGARIRTAWRSMRSRTSGWERRSTWPAGKCCWTSGFGGSGRIIRSFS